MANVVLAERTRSTRAIITLRFLRNTMKYCQERDWRVDTGDGFPHQEQSRRALEHFLETGHTVDSRDSFGRLPRRPISGRLEVLTPVPSEETPFDTSTK